MLFVFTDPFEGRRPGESKAALNERFLGFLLENEAARERWSRHVSSASKEVIERAMAMRRRR